MEKQSKAFLVDSHVHLDDSAFNVDRSEVILFANQIGVKWMLNPGADLDSSRRAVALAEKHASVYAGVGIHPHDAKDAPGDWEAQLRALAMHPKTVALGEMGLDYHYDHSPREMQQDIFRRQLRLAIELNKPVIIHEREAPADTLEILRQEEVKRVGGVMHCFSGSRETAELCMKMGLYISFAGPVTFKNARRSLEVASAIPLDRLLVETDAPYLAPEPYRGKRNEPGHVLLVAQKIAEMRGMTLQEFGAAITFNAEQLFGVSI
jgi:TatD DNase family protein